MPNINTRENPLIAKRRAAEADILGTIFETTKRTRTSARTNSETSFPSSLLTKASSFTLLSHSCATSLSVKDDDDNDDDDDVVVAVDIDETTSFSSTVSVPVDEETRSAHKNLPGHETKQQQQQLPLIIVDLACLVDKYSWPEIEVIKRAADFMFSCRLVEDSFGLYILVWKRLQNSSKPIFMIQNAIISAVRSASKESHLAIVGNILEQRLESMKDNVKFTTAELERYTYLMLLTQVRHRQGDVYATISLSKNITSFMLSLKRFLYSPENNIHINLITYMYLNRWAKFFLSGEQVLRSPNKSEFILQSIYDTPLTVDIVKLEDDLNRDHPGTFVLQLRIVLQRQIRRMLKWFIHILEQGISLPDFNPPPTDNEESKISASVYILFSYMWTQWNSKGALDNDKPRWAADVEQFLGISAAEMMQVLTTTLLKFKGTKVYYTENSDPPSKNGSEYKSFLNQALDAAKNLFAASHDTLRTHFFRSLADQYDPSGPLDSDATLKSYLYGYMKELVQEKLNLVLPPLPPLGAVDNTTHFTTLTFMNRVSEDMIAKGSVNRYDPTIAPSMSSSENSLKQVANQIADNLRRQGRAETSDLSSNGLVMSWAALLHPRSRPTSFDTLSSKMSSLSISTK
jgi:hypothetical protein